jgi:DNA-binding CsgD family transcriptional regulator
MYPILAADALIRRNACSCDSKCVSGFASFGVYVFAASNVNNLACARNAGVSTPKEAKPETHLLSQLQALRRISASAANIGYMPEQVRLDAPKIQRHAMELQQELGRDPSDAELADHIGIPIERIARARKGTAAFTSSSLPEGVETTLPSYEKENRNNWAKYVYHDLTPAGQIVMEHTLGLNGKPLLSTEEIARKANISTGRVSQYRADIEKALNSYVKFVS